MVCRSPHSQVSEPAVYPHFTRFPLHLPTVVCNRLRVFQVVHYRHPLLLPLLLKKCCKSFVFGNYDVKSPAHGRIELWFLWLHSDGKGSPNSNNFMGGKFFFFVLRQYLLDLATSRSWVQVPQVVIYMRMQTCEDLLLFTWMHCLCCYNPLLAGTPWYVFRRFALLTQTEGKDFCTTFPHFFKKGIFFIYFFNSRHFGTFWKVHQEIIKHPCLLLSTELCCITKLDNQSKCYIDRSLPFKVLIFANPYLSAANQENKLSNTSDNCFHTDNIQVCKPNNSWRYTTSKIKFLWALKYEFVQIVTFLYQHFFVTDQLPLVRNLFC